MDEVIALIEQTRDFVDFYTVEHLKLPKDNAAICKSLLSRMEGLKVRLVSKGREYEFDTETKLANIAKIKEVANGVKVGCGDNDLHILSDCLNCCGVDLMPKAFSNWYKYNSMYIKMTGKRDVWKPNANCNECWNGDCVIKGFTKMEQYTDKAFIKQYGHPQQLTLNL